MENRSESWLIYNLVKLHILGVKDEGFTEPVYELLKDNAAKFAEESDRFPILFIWQDLVNKDQVFSDSLLNKVDQLISRPHVLKQMGAYQVVHYLWAVGQIEPKPIVGETEMSDRFKFLLEELFERKKMTVFDIRRIIKVLDQTGNGKVCTE